MDILGAAPQRSSGVPRGQLAWVRSSFEIYVPQLSEQFKAALVRTACSIPAQPDSSVKASVQSGIFILLAFL